MERLVQCKQYRCNLGRLGAADGSINPFRAEVSFSQLLSFLQTDDPTHLGLIAHGLLQGYYCTAPCYWLTATRRADTQRLSVNNKHVH